MTIQGKANEILELHARAHESAQMMRLAQDRKLLLEALKAHDAYMSAGYDEGPASKALHPWAAENWLLARYAIAQAERE